MIFKISLYISFHWIKSLFVFEDKSISSLCLLNTKRGLKPKPPMYFEKKKKTCFNPFHFNKSFSANLIKIKCVAMGFSELVDSGFETPLDFP